MDGTLNELERAIEEHKEWIMKQVLAVSFEKGKVWVK